MQKKKIAPTESLCKDHSSYDPYTQNISYHRLQTSSAFSTLRISCSLFSTSSRPAFRSVLCFPLISRMLRLYSAKSVTPLTMSSFLPPSQQHPTQQHPWPTQLHSRTRRRPARVCRRDYMFKKSSDDSFCRQNTRARPFNAPEHSFSASLALSPHEALFSLSKLQLPFRTLSASTASEPLHQAGFSTQPAENSRRAVFRKKG